MEWTEESIRLLTAFWADGLSTAEIGRRLGVSKNAVVGKAHRLELSARPSPIRWDGPPKLRTKRRPSSAPRITGATLPPLESTVPAGSPLVAPRPLAPRPAAVSAGPRPAQPGSAPHAFARPGAGDPRAAESDSGRTGGGTAPARAVPATPAPGPAARQNPPPPPPAGEPAPERTQNRPAAAGSSRPQLQAVAPRPYGRVVTCCWPIGEPGTRDFRFCDSGSVPGKPYCEEHAALAYVKVRDRREDAA